MIRYEQLETKTNGQRDVRVVTDDRNAELVEIDAVYYMDLVSYNNFKKSEINSEGKFEWIIPGDEVGDVSEFMWEVDAGKLEHLIDEWNTKAIDDVLESKENK